MVLTEVDGPAGAPWERPLAGALDKLVVESELLAGNPLGDSERRPLYVYRPPGVEAGAGESVPAVYVIQGYTGQVDMWVDRSAFEPNMIERLDAMFAAGECPDAIVVFVDAWTRYGGSQFLNSAGNGRYLDYLCDEVVGFVDERYPTIPGPDHRGIAGKSSGGYGAMVVPMLRPGVFGALASHAGDALFECAYLPEFPQAARALRDHFEGSYENFIERFESADRFDFDKQGTLIEMYGYALAYSPDLERPGKPLIPFDLETGAVIEDVWAKWLALDPVRMAAGPRRRAHLDAQDLSRRRQERRVVSRPRRDRVRPRAREDRRRAHPRALRRQARRHDLPLPRRDPRARARARLRAVEAERPSLDGAAFLLALAAIGIAALAFVATRNGAALIMCSILLAGLVAGRVAGIAGGTLLLVALGLGAVLWIVWIDPVAGPRRTSAIAHFTGGALVAWALGQTLKARGFRHWAEATIVVVAALTVGWEIAEIIGDRVLDTALVPNRTDSALDIFFGCLGGLAGLGVAGFLSLRADSG